MTSIALERSDVIVGVDTHKDQHVAVTLDGLGGRLEQRCVPATNDGYAELLAWADAQGRVVAFGVEGTGSYGIGLARFLRRHARCVIEVSRPPRKDQRRAAGKSDPVDAEHAARQVLAGTATVAPKASDGDIETLRLLKVARDTAVKAQSQTMVTLKATLVTASDDLRAELEALSNFKLVTACAAFDSDDELACPDTAMRHVLGVLARRWLALHAEAKTLARQLTQRTQAAAPQLLDAFGVGPDIAAELLIAVGDNGDRIRSEAAFAKLCGVCPIPASSGKTTRHRLNRGGNRQANSALFRAVVVRMRWHEPTRTYVARRTAEGKSKREIIRCLKRYLARELYHLLPPTQTTDERLHLAA
ncbi:IS110 family transposase [Egibacter rhizosphaerae]|uniref:IS110 family transposase n=1 Tax=Egibacter rhizosphaerae TaxID=1670831 RepID=A0A411YGU4_9ACTN|nr:IS110 family transposase [Egibacter rhizosphaerae]QBI20535.1 IS110 family transposase [Egibacter rhizosphaerae]